MSTDKMPEPVPRWWTCKTHGDAMPRNAWGCPECVRELRAERDALRAALAAQAAEMKHCGKENCMGWREGEIATWVREERLLKVERERDTLRSEVETLRADAAKYRWLKTHGPELDAAIEQAWSELKVNTIAKE